MPFISAFLWTLLTLSFGLIVILYIFMLPARSASQEMSFAYYVLAVPHTVKIISSIGLLALSVTIPLYFASRLNKPGQVIFDQDKITVRGNDIDLTMKSKLIGKIFINDLKNSKRELKHKLQIVLQPKYGKQVVFQLKDYGDSDQFIAAIGELKNVEFSFYDDNVSTFHHHE